MTNSFTHNATGDTGRHPLTRELIGSCGVDSGTLIVVDPLYLSRDLADECGEVGTGGVVTSPAGEPLAVTTNRFGGDGYFPVYAVVDDAGVTIRLEVDLSRGGSGRLEPGPVATSTDTRPTLRVVRDDETAFGSRFDPTIDELLAGDEPDVEKLARIVETAVMRLIDDTDPTAFLPENYERTAERMAVLIERVALRVMSEPTADESEADVLDGEQGITVQLQPMPDGFVEWAHNRIVELLQVARDSDRWVEGDERVTTESRATYLGAVAMRSAGYRPHRDPTVRVLRDEQVEHALHDLLDALVHGWQVAQLNRQSRLDETTAVACLRSVTT